MATMDQLMTALRGADAAGNTQDASRIAQIIKGMQPQQRQGTDGAFAYGVDRAQMNIQRSVTWTNASNEYVSVFSPTLLSTLNPHSSFKSTYHLLCSQMRVSEQHPRVLVT